jgi:hypothetical protein
VTAHELARELLHGPDLEVVLMIVDTSDAGIYAAPVDTIHVQDNVIRIEGDER